MSLWVRIAAAALLTAQVALVGLAVWANSPLLSLFAEVALLSVGALVALTTRYLHLRGEYGRERHRARATAERQRLADEVHDQVGHELSLIGLQAGLLELSPDSETARLAAQIRRRAADAVSALHETIALLGDHPAEHAGTTSAARRVAEFTAAGGDAKLEGSSASWPAPVRLATTSLIREALTNAGRHAAGRPVRVRLTTSGNHAQVEVSTTGIPEPVSDRVGHGLSSQRRRAQALGGSLAVVAVADEHRVTMRVPLSSPRVEPAVQPRTPGPVSTMARQLGLPIGAVVAIIVGFYSWASHAAVIEPAAQARLTVGMARADAESLVPRRETPVSLVRRPPHPPGWTCRIYTDGNFPLAVATVEVCLDDRRVTRVTDLSDTPLL